MKQTERLLLRRFTKEDVKAAHELFCDEEAMRLDGMYPAFTTLEQTEERIREWSNSEIHTAIVLKETGELLGYLVVNPDSEEDRDDTRELGFALIAKYRGYGYMTEAVKAILEELAARNIVYVWACCFKENVASEKLIRNLGFEFQQEGTYDAPDKTYESLEFRMEL